MNDLLRRVGQALKDLEGLSDAPTSKIDPNRVQAGENIRGLDSKILRDHSDYEFCLNSLEQWCEFAERRVSLARKKEAREATKLEETYWFLEEWEGKRASTVADKTGLSVDDVKAKRRRAGRNPENGRPLDIAA